MNINIEFWGNTFGSRADLEIPHNNIAAGAKLLSLIIANVENPASVEVVATLYNDLGATTVSDYGARAAAIFRSRPWAEQ